MSIKMQFPPILVPPSLVYTLSATAVHKSLCFLFHLAKKSQITVDTNIMTLSHSGLFLLAWRLSASEHLSTAQLLASRKCYAPDLEPGLHSSDRGGDLTTHFYP